MPLDAGPRRLPEEAAPGGWAWTGAAAWRSLCRQPDMGSGDEGAGMDSEGFLKGAFRGILGRDPEADSVAYLIEQFAAGRPFEALVKEIASSEEARRRYGETVRTPASQDSGVASFVPPGHFYSPVCDPGALETTYRDPALAAPGMLVPGIRMNAEGQLKLWELWRPMLAELPFPEQPSSLWRYHYNNPAFGPADAAVLHCMLRWLRPRRYVEVGIGYSSACAIDTIEHFLDGQPRPVFIDPYPEVLRKLLRPGDEATLDLHAVPVQKIDPSLWDSLQADDILFVDTSHVAKTGSDVLAVVFDILPRLKPGVVVHIHDMFFPFEYPRGWVMDENRSWNELYLVRSFLTDNPGWEILFFNDFFRRLAPGLVAETCPPYARHSGGSLWLRRI